jgi:arylformamidase
MKLYDITVPLTNDLASWPGEDGFNRKERNAGEEAIVSDITVGSHTGTHIDSPKHFKNKGTVDEIDLQSLIGECLVVEITHEGQINSSDVDNLPDGTERVIFKTSNTSRNLLDDQEFHKDFVSLDVSAAEAIVKKGIKLVGVDYLSVEQKGAKGHPVHNTLLKAGVVSLEACYLKDINPGKYEIIALPLRIKEGDGSPARVILKK